MQVIIKGSVKEIAAFVTKLHRRHKEDFSRKRPVKGKGQTLSVDGKAQSISFDVF